MPPRSWLIAAIAAFKKWISLLQYLLSFAISRIHFSLPFFSLEEKKQKNKFANEIYAFGIRNRA